MKNFLLTALLGLLVLNPIQHVVAPLTPQQCEEVRKEVMERPYLIEDWSPISGSKIPSLKHIILLKCGISEAEIRTLKLGILKQRLDLALDNREKIVQEKGIYTAYEVLKSHEEVKRVMHDIRILGGFFSDKSAEVVLNRVIELAPDALISTELCVKGLSYDYDEFEKEKRKNDWITFWVAFYREKGIAAYEILTSEACITMYWVFRKEVKSSFKLIKSNQLNWAGKRAELNFIKPRVNYLEIHEIGLHGKIIDSDIEVFKKKIEAIEATFPRWALI